MMARRRASLVVLSSILALSVLAFVAANAPRSPWKGKQTFTVTFEAQSAPIEGLQDAFPHKPMTRHELEKLLTRMLDMPGGKFEGQCTYSGEFIRLDPGTAARIRIKSLK